MSLGVLLLILLALWWCVYLTRHSRRYRYWRAWRRVMRELGTPAPRVDSRDSKRIFLNESDARRAQRG